MNKIEAREQLNSFYNGETLTFSFENFPSGEWIATCNEIPAIVTGGMNDDITSKDSMIREAIVTAAGIPAEHGDVLRFMGYGGVREVAQSFMDRVRSKQSVTREAACYVLS